MSTTIERRVTTLEQTAGEPAEPHCIFVTFSDEGLGVAGFERLSETMAPIDRRPDEDWAMFKARAASLVSHIPLAVLIPRMEAHSVA